MAADPGFLMMVPFHGEARPRAKASLTCAIMLATIVSASTTALFAPFPTPIGHHGNLLIYGPRSRALTEPRRRIAAS